MIGSNFKVSLLSFCLKEDRLSRFKLPFVNSLFFTFQKAVLLIMKTVVRYSFGSSLLYLWEPTKNAAAFKASKTIELENLITSVH